MEPTITEQLVDAFDLSGFPPEEQEQIAAELADVLTEAILVRAVPALSDADGAAYDELVAQNAELRDLSKFLEERTPNFQAIALEEIEALKAKLAALEPGEQTEQ